MLLLFLIKWFSYCFVMIGQLLHKNNAITRNPNNSKRFPHSWEYRVKIRTWVSSFGRPLSYIWIRWYFWITIMLQEEFDHNKGVNRSRKSKKDRQHNTTRTPLKSGGELMCSGRVSSSCPTSGIILRAARCQLMLGVALSKQHFAMNGHRTAANWICPTLSVLSSFTRHNKIKMFPIGQFQCHIFILFPPIATTPNEWQTLNKRILPNWMELVSLSFLDRMFVFNLLCIRFLGIGWSNYCFTGSQRPFFVVEYLYF